MSFLSEPLRTLLPQGLAFVDIETTGGPAQRESITEVGIVELTEDGVREWSTLVRPEMRIPEHIQRLTGISNEMVADAPRFAEIADALYDRLDGRLFVAHNARFDHGYLRAAFRRSGMDLRPRVLCTVKLSRRLYPEQRRHSLDHLIARHRLEVAERHRALGDAHLLWQFWQRVHDQFPAGAVADAVRGLIGRPTLPAHLDETEIDRIPDHPGVYLFYGENDLPLYIGKSTRLRTRVLSHFSADHASDRELRLSQQIRRVDWIQTAGETGALLKEAALIKDLQPVFNRALRRNRDLCAWRLEHDLLGDFSLRLVHADALDFGQQDDVFGLFRSRREALNRLRAIAREHALCPTLLGLEKRDGGGRCFNFQLKRCHGACIGQEAPAAHATRVREALAALRLAAWPFAGPVALREGHDLHLIDGWRYLGTAQDEPGLQALLATGRPLFDLDFHRILVKALARAGQEDLVVPGAAADNAVVRKRSKS